MANPIRLPSGRRWHGPALWKVVGLLVGMLALFAVLIYGGQTWRWWGTPEPNASTSAPRHQAGPLNGDSLLPVSMRRDNGVVPGLPPDEAALKREADYRKALEEAHRLNERHRQRLEELMARIESQERGTRSASSGSPQKDPEAEARRKARAKWRVASGMVYSTPLTPAQLTGERLYELQPGWKIPYIVKPLLNSAVPGAFEAQVSETVYDSATGTIPLIPQGASIVGDSQSARLIPGHERLPTIGVTISMSNGRTIDLGNMPMMDAMGQNGLADEVDTHLARNAFGWLVGGFLRGSTRVIQQETGSMPMGAIAGGIAQETQRGSGPIIQQLYDVRPTIRVLPGSRGHILLTKSLKLPAYRPGMGGYR